MNTEINIFGKKVNIISLIKICAKIGLLALILVSIYLLNHSVLLSPDDYNYTFVQGSNLKKISSFSDCLETGRFFYNNWTGRVIPHVLIGIFRNLNPNVYEIVNTLVFMIFISTIPKVLNKKSTFLSILSVFGYLAYSKMFGEKFAWISGSFNYLWPSTFLVILIYYIYNYFQEEIDLNILQKIALVLFSFIAGFMHENTAFVGGAFFICLILFNIKKFFKFDKKKILFISLVVILFGLGAIANIFAPGNLLRMNQDGKQFSFEFLKNYSENKVPLLFVFLSMIIVFILENIEKIKKQKGFSIKKLKEYDISTIKIEILYFILPAIIATIPMAVIGYFPPRAFLAYEVMFMIVLSKNVIIIAKYFEKHNVLIAISCIIFTLIVFGKYSPSTLAQINYLIPYKEKVTSEYEISAKNGEKDVVVSKFEFLQWIHREDYINIDNFFPEFNYKMPTNALISMYYGFDRLTAIGDDEYLIEIEVDREGIHPYDVIEKGTERNVAHIEYDNQIRYSIPKKELGKFLLDCRENGIADKIKSFKVRCVGGEELNSVTLDELIIK